MTVGGRGQATDMRSTPGAHGEGLGHCPAEHQCCQGEEGSSELMGSCLHMEVSGERSLGKPFRDAGQGGASAGSQRLALGSGAWAMVESWGPSLRGPPPTSCLGCSSRGCRHTQVLGGFPPLRPRLPPQCLAQAALSPEHCHGWWMSCSHIQGLRPGCTGSALRTGARQSYRLNS